MSEIPINCDTKAVEVKEDGSYIAQCVRCGQRSRRVPAKVPVDRVRMQCHVVPAWPIGDWVRTTLEWYVWTVTFGAAKLRKCQSCDAKRRALNRFGFRLSRRISAIWLGVVGFSPRHTKG